MELHEGNPFKIKSLLAAAFRIDKFPKKLDGLSLQELESLEGVGKSIAQKIYELNTSGSMEELNELIQQTPPGVLSMLQIKGLGPKKVQSIWKEMNIESVGELHYACIENRLIEAKGFGSKTQEEILKNIEFLQNAEGKYLYAAVETLATSILDVFMQAGFKASFTGMLRRRSEILECLDLLVATENPKDVYELIDKNELLQDCRKNDDEISGSNNDIPVRITLCSPTLFYYQLYIQTGSPEHIEQAGKISSENFSSEKDIYTRLGLSYIEPEMREGLAEIEKAKKGALPTLIELSDLKGILHNHSTYSDGIHSLREMALYAKESGYEYLGICDHSQTAVYAKGLKPERVIEQHQEIEKLNQELAPFRIFKGIESDILTDGSLDYDAGVLSRFDFIVASIHQGFKMDIEKATNRLIKAIENPYTTILGHPTGRLLLGRAGYPINHKQVIDACAQNGVVIELNANPLRLDIDWRWIDYALSKDVFISINPDAHRKEGYHDMYYGVLAARKGGLFKEKCFNALSREEMDDFFIHRREKSSLKTA